MRRNHGRRAAPKFCAAVESRRILSKSATFIGHRNGSTPRHGSSTTMGSKESDDLVALGRQRDYQLGEGVRDAIDLDEL